MVDFAYFCKSDTDNVSLHGRNYTVGRWCVENGKW
jgi:hypothetical protein